MFNATLIFIDGENLALRYQEMLKSGRIPRSDNVVIENCFVWNQRILEDHLWELKRISYYTSVVGDDKKVKEVREKIASITFSCNPGETTSDGEQIEITGQIIPFVRKKSSKSRKESICDIAIAVDVMRACYRNHAETIWVFSGDGDFVQLFHEAVHSGKRVYASAFSSGLNDEIRFVVDEFMLLDEYFFEPEVKKKVAKPVSAVGRKKVAKPVSAVGRKKVVKPVSAVGRKKVVKPVSAVGRKKVVKPVSAVDGKKKGLPSSR